MRLSYSRLSAFINCGFLYKLKYVHRIPSRPKPHLGFGRILHSTLNRFYNLNFDAPSLNDLLRIYRESWRTGADAPSKSYDRGLHILRRYYELNIEHYHKAVYIEQPFEIPIIPIGYHTLAGRFDRVDRIDNDTYEIIDYKVARHVPPQSEVDSNLQLGIYSLAFRLTTGKLPILSFYYLPENAKVTSRRTDRELTRIRSGLDSIVSKLMSGEHFEPHEGMECKWCDYKQYCPSKAESPLPLPRGAAQLEFTINEQ